MTSTVDAEKIELFNEQKPRLFGIAYRMLGTRDDAEDILQETYLRLHSADLSVIESAEAWLVTVATRLSIDRLRKASVQRETYIGPWLPEPLIIDPAMSPEIRAETASNVSMAFMVLLERLSPLERAIFLLHDVFDFAHAEIARVVAKSETAVRQIVSRARTRVRSEKARFEPDKDSRSDLIRKFMAASYARDEQALMSIFADDVALTSDGGGKVNAARRVVYGNRRITRLYTVALAKHRDRIRAELVTINGEPGVVEFADGEVFAATTFSVSNGKITAIYRVMNPDKLRGIASVEKKV